MSSGDSITKSFGDVPKLLGKENYVKMEAEDHLGAFAYSLKFVRPPISYYSLSTQHIDIPLSTEHAQANSDWIDRDH